MRAARRLAFSPLAQGVAGLAVGSVLGLVAAVSVTPGVLILAAALAAFLGVCLAGIFREYLALPLLIVLILTPSFEIGRGTPSLRLEFIVVLVLWALLLFNRLLERSNPRQGGELTLPWRMPFTYLGFGLFAGVIAFSMTYASLLKGYQLAPRDFWEFIKVAEYFLVFSFVASLRLAPERLSGYYSASLAILALSAFFGLAQYFNLGNVNTTLSPMYAPTQLEGILVMGRITGTTANPNEFGALMVLGSALALSRALFSATGSWWVSSAYLALFVLTLMLTLSRSAMIALLITGFAVLLGYGMTVGSRALPKLFVAVLLLVCLALLTVGVAPPKFFYRFNELRTYWMDTSWQSRVENWKENLAIWVESPLFGWGPGKASMRTVTDNEWILLMRRYGIFGVLVFIGWFVSFYSGLTQIRRDAATSDRAALAVALQGTLLGYGVFMLAAAVYHLLQLMPTLFFFLGLAYAEDVALEPKRRAAH